MIIESLLTLHTTRSLKILETFQRNYTFHLHQTENIGNVFAGIPRICFKNGKSLKDHFIRSVLPKVEVVGNSGQSDGKWPPGKLCRLIKETSTFI